MRLIKKSTGLWTRWNVNMKTSGGSREIGRLRLVRKMSFVSDVRWEDQVRLASAGDKTKNLQRCKMVCALPAVAALTTCSPAFHVSGQEVVG